MINQSNTKTKYFSVFLLFILNLSVIGFAHSTEFEIDEIITAIKNEIKTANISELGSPKFKIESVDVTLAVVSIEDEKGEIAVKIIGLGNEGRNEVAYDSPNMLSFSFQPTGASNFTPEISLGLVEPIKEVKSTLRKAYNTPPSFKMEAFTFKLEFGIEKNADGGIRFRILKLEDFKAQNVSTHYIIMHMKIIN